MSSPTTAAGISAAMKSSSKAASLVDLKNRQDAGLADMAFSAEMAGGFTFHPGHSITDPQIVAWRLIEDVLIATDGGAIAFHRDRVIDDPSAARDIAAAGLLMSLQPLTERELSKKLRSGGIPTPPRLAIAVEGQACTVSGEIEPGDKISVVVRAVAHADDALVALRVDLDQVRRQRDAIWDMHLKLQIRDDDARERLAELAKREDALRPRLAEAEQRANAVHEFSIVVAAADTFESIARQIAEKASILGALATADGATITVDPRWAATYLLSGLQPREPASCGGMF